MSSTYIIQIYIQIYIYSHIIIKTRFFVNLPFPPSWIDFYLSQHFHLFLYLANIFASAAAMAAPALRITNKQYTSGLMLV